MTLMEIFYMPGMHLANVERSVIRGIRLGSMLLEKP